MVKLQSTDGEVFELPLRLAKQFDPVTSYLVSTGINGDPEEVPFPIEVSSQALKAIVDWSLYRQDDPESDEETEVEDRASKVTPWDLKFAKNLGDDLALETLSACHYLQHKPMLRVLVKIVASWIRGKSVEFLRAKLKIENDYTPEEEEELKEKNAWTEKLADDDEASSSTESED